MKKVLSFLSAIVIGAGLIATPAYATSNTSNTSKSVEGTMAIPEVKGTEISKEESVKLFNDIQNKMIGLNSFQMKIETTATAEGNTITIPVVLDMDIAKAQFKGEFQAMGESAEIYLVDQKMYLLDGKTKEAVWLHMPITPELMRVKTQVDDRALSLVKVEKTNDGYVIKTPKDTTLGDLVKLYPELEFFKNYIYLNAKEAIKQQAPAGTDEKMVDDVANIILNDIKFTVQAEYTNDLLPKNMYYTATVDLSKFDKSAPKFDISAKYEFSKFNEIEEIKLPAEMKNAKFMLGEF